MKRAHEGDGGEIYTTPVDKRLRSPSECPEPRRLVAACLGVSVEEAAAQGVGMGWSLGEDGMFGVVRRKVDDEAEALGMDAVEKLSAMMVHVTDIAGPDEDED